MGTLGARGVSKARRGRIGVQNAARHTAQQPLIQPPVFHHSHLRRFIDKQHTRKETSPHPRNNRTTHPAARMMISECMAGEYSAVGEVWYKSAAMARAGVL